MSSALGDGTYEDTAAAMEKYGGLTPSNHEEYTTEGEAKILQEHIDLLSDNPLRNYTEKVHFTGANAIFCTDVFQLRGTADLTKTGKLHGAVIHNQLKKDSTDERFNSVQKVIQKWCQYQEASVWMSTVLAVDLDLPMRTAPIPGTVQVLVLAQYRPFLLVTLFDETDKEIDSKTVRDYSTEMCQLLTPSLHRFCSEDFALLACTMSLENFNKEILEEEIRQRREVLDGFYGGPMEVSKAAYSKLVKAVALAASTTNVPYHLKMKDLNPNEDQAWLLYLDEDWRKILSLLTEMLHQTSGITITTRTPDTEAKVEVALLEIARRFSFTEDVVIVSNDDQIRCWFDRVVAEVRDEYETNLRLKLVEQQGEHLTARYIIGMDSYETILSLMHPCENQCVIKLTGGSSPGASPTRSRFVRGYSTPAPSTRSQGAMASASHLPEAAGEDNIADEIQMWVLQEKLSPETLNVLKQQNFTSMKKLRLLKSEDVKEHLKGILPLADCLALQKAVTRLPKASRSRQHETFRILLMGKSGSGKSSTGNTILGKDVFLYGQSLQGITRRCEFRYKTKKNGLTIEIIDSPGLFDPASNCELEQEIVKTVALLDPGPTAVLYVVKFGRYTEEEFETYQRLKTLFDADITRYITIVFTGGDMLKKEHTRVEDCIRDAGEHLRQVLAECQNRYVVFNNHDSKRNKKVCVNDLLDKLRHNLRTNGNRPYRSRIQEHVGRELEDLVQDKVRQSTKLKGFDRKITLLECEAKSYMSKVKDLEQKIESLTQKHDELEERESRRTRQDKEKMDEIADLRKEIHRLNNMLKKKSNDLEKLNRQKESERKKEEAEERKKLKATIAEDKYQRWVENLTSSLQPDNQHPAKKLHSRNLVVPMPEII